MLFCASKKGFATLEMLIAMALLVIAISATLPLVFGGQSMAVSMETSEEALYKAKNLLETARADAKFDFNLVNPAGPVADGIYQKSLSVSQTGFFTKQVSALVAWPGENGRNLETRLSTLITNPAGINTGDTCSSVATGDWSRPALLNASHPIDIGLDTISGIDVANGMAYITGFHSGTNDDFFAVDVSDPTFPKIVGRLDASLPGLADVAIGGHYAYVANRSLTGQLQVIDISDPAHVPPPVASKKVPGAGGVGNAIFYDKGKVYLGLTASGAGPQLVVFDVSNPTAPVQKGSYTIGHDVNDIKVKNGYVYVATPDSEELKVFDVSNPAIISLAGGSGNLPDTTANGKSVFVVGSTAYLGRTVGLSSTTKQLYSFDRSNPAVNPLPVVNSQDVNNSVNNLVVRGGQGVYFHQRGFPGLVIGNLGLAGIFSAGKRFTGRGNGLRG